jgi:hypothetical protein
MDQNTNLEKRQGGKLQKKNLNLSIRQALSISTSFNYIMFISGEIQVIWKTKIFLYFCISILYKNPDIFSNVDILITPMLCV